MKKFLLLFAFLAIGLSPGFCAENILNSIELSQNDDGYELKLNTQEPVAFKKKVESSDSVYFDLKNVVAPDKIDTIYNNVSDIDGVVIQQIGKNQIRIYVNGLDASSTKLVTQTSIAGTEKETKEIIINRPMSEYAPITGAERYAETSDWENNDFNAKHLASAILAKIKKSKINFALVFSFMIVIASLIGIKRAFSKARADEEFIGINKKAFDDLTQSDAAPDTQDSLLEKLSAQNNRKPAPVPRAPINNYALNSYQKSQNVNPYMNGINRGATISQPQRRIIEPSKPMPAVFAPEGLRPTSPSNGSANPPSSGVLDSTHGSRIKKEFSTNIASTPAPIKKQAVGAAQGKNVENIQFLESITKIYEQSGRKDLANGLRANINKIRSAV